MLDHDADELGVSDDVMEDDDEAAAETEARLMEKADRFRENQERTQNRIAALEKEVSDLKALLKEKGVI